MSKADVFHVFFKNSPEVELCVLNSNHGDAILLFGKNLVYNSYTPKNAFTRHIAFEEAKKLLNFVLKNCDTSIFYKDEIVTMKGFDTSVYGYSTAKSIKKNPKKTGRKMARAYRSML